LQLQIRQRSQPNQHYSKTLLAVASACKVRTETMVSKKYYANAVLVTGGVVSTPVSTTRALSCRRKERGVIKECW
jgi:hypothetical protein